MKTVASYYGLVDKETWGPGPWQDEPDRLEWVDEATDLTCIILRNPLTGALCGYVGVPLGHPWQGKRYTESRVRVHGGLTYGDYHLPCCDESGSVFWFGFDCSHIGDLSPGLDAKIRESRCPTISELAAALGAEAPDLIADLYREEYRTVAYVRAECTRLAAQIVGLD